MEARTPQSQQTFGFLGEVEKVTGDTLMDRFVVPPFSVLDTRQGYWQERKTAWLALGIKGELGRGECLTWGDSDTEQGRSKLAKAYSCNDGQQGKYDYLPDISTGTSIFDPVLCELAYRWFCPPNGLILDPFAGGSVRGIVASYMGRRYIGVDLSERQIEANKVQAQEIVPDNQPTWKVGDASDINEIFRDMYFDFIFTCPPYYDLEVYSDSPRDLSTFPSYSRFVDAYTKIILQCVNHLKQDRFACFVVGDIRDNKGFYRNFPGDTIAAFQETGMKLYNEAILVTAVGSLPIRVGSQFQGKRKLGKTHQNILVFYKGDPEHIENVLDHEAF